jgi:hypothetical protein
VFVTLSQEGNSPQMWEFDPTKVRASQGEMVEKRYGQPWDVFLRDLIKGSMLARRVLLWHLMRLAHHTLRYEDTPDFYSSELTVEYSRAELESMRATAETSKALTEDERSQALAVLDDEIAKAPTGVDEGKALSGSDSPATG